MNDIPAMDNNKEIRQKILKAKLFASIHIFKAMLPILTKSFAFNIFRFLKLPYLFVSNTWFQKNYQGGRYSYSHSYKQTTDELSLSSLSLS